MDEYVIELYDHVQGGKFEFARTNTLNKAIDIVMDHKIIAYRLTHIKTTVITDIKPLKFR